MNIKHGCLAIMILTGPVALSFAGSPDISPANANPFFVKLGVGPSMVNYKFNPPQARANSAGQELIESLGNISTSQVTLANQFSAGYTHEWEGGLIFGGEIGVSKRYGTVQNNNFTVDDVVGETITNYTIENRVSLYPKILIGKQTSSNTMLIFGAGAEFADNEVRGSSVKDLAGVNQLTASYSRNLWQIGPTLSAEFDYSFNKRWKIYVEDDIAYFPSKDIGTINTQDPGGDAASIQNTGYELSAFKNDIMFGLRVQI